MAIAAPTRLVDNRDLPVAGRWQVDTSHSSVEFVARHLMIARVRGRFTDFAGTIDVGDTPEDSSVEVTIQAASISTGDEKRDEHLRSADFLDSERFPVLEFRSAAVAARGSRWTVSGDLTIRGVTRPVVLDVEFDGAAIDPWGNAKVAFSASTEINREDFGLLWNAPLETGGVVVGPKVRIELGIEATRV